MKYFATLDISPADLRERAWTRLNELYKQVRNVWNEELRISKEIIISYLEAIFFWAGGEVTRIHEKQGE